LNCQKITLSAAISCPSSSQSVFVSTVQNLKEH
jgi:hypothetical protein